MLGTLLSGRYTLLHELGAGGFGQTYLAEDATQERQCVVKQFKPSSHDKQVLDVARRLFKTEVNTLRRLGQHGQIPDFYDAFEEQGEFYLVQEFIDGRSIADEFSNRGRLSEPAVVSLIKDVLDVLQFVHANQVIHRDIKPGNLIRRYSDGKVVLIDFGAVKEIQTQISTLQGETNLTVGIGTQGYTPSEQLMGKPRYCSDIYALGMTAIQAVTGLPPVRLPDDDLSLEVLWHNRAELSPGMTFVIDCMVRHDHHRRYQSADEVLQALQQLEDLPADATDISTELLLPASQVTEWLETQQKPVTLLQRARQGWRGMAIATTLISGLLVGARHLGWLQPLELAVQDQMTRLSAAQTPDPRLLVVGITEADLQQLQRVTPSDATIAEAIAQLQTLEPRLIGLDLLRDLPQEPGRPELLEQLAAENVIGILHLGDEGSNRVPPPPTMPAERLGFNDVVLDDDNVIRRNLLFATSDGEGLYAFSTRLALRYLMDEGIEPRASEQRADVVVLGDRPIPPLESTFGGYQTVDARGYQTLLHYPTAQPAEMVSLSQVLAGELEADQVRDRIILIGTTAPSAKDLFYTPFTAGRADLHQMPGVMVHAAKTSQLLALALDGQPVPWSLPHWANLGLIGICAAAGGAIAWMIRHPALVGVGLGGGILVLVSVGWVAHQRAGWVPLATPAIALLLSGIGVTAYRLHYQRQQPQTLTEFLQYSPTIQMTKPSRD
ncbi:MAG: CHASE2 domain-containing protein [Kaiparowitsia implicata GSE-PSE-MK54-09C]|jgi:CHASE2 domain-containing sensor protein/tRNA A-37 threonylcarbamoyl transferase component Bud32|nr:CHASE2 domain-containing protein [Kaiparowitsia implicata GSE-PSE-MK54-09C]